MKILRKDMHSYQYILAAIDLSPSSKQVAQRAAEVARRYGSKLGLVHVLEHPPLVLEVQGLLDTLKVDAHDSLTTLGAELGFDSASIWVTVGSPKREITRIAHEQAADLIVIGSHGQHGIALLAGSTANGVLHLAPCDVLTVRIED